MKAMRLERFVFAGMCTPPKNGAQIIIYDWIAASQFLSWIPRMALP